jgi:fibronectin-binding autotransporter adhesin
LKQVDFDGNVVYSDVVMVQYESEDAPRLNVYPNPTAGNTIKIEMEGVTSTTEMQVAFFDQLGKLQLQVTLSVDDTGYATGEVSVDNLTSGVYVLKFGDSGFVRKLIVTDK